MRKSFVTALAVLVAVVAVSTAAAFAQVVRPKGTIVGEARTLTTLVPPPAPAPPPASAPAAATGGATGYRIMLTTFPLPGGSGMWANAYCSSPTHHPVGGGVQTSSPIDTEVKNSFPVDRSVDPSATSSGWKVYVLNKSMTVPLNVKVFVICLDAAI